jgi:hypothetical protein
MKQENYSQVKMIGEWLIRGRKNGQEYNIDHFINDVHLVFNNKLSPDILVFEQHIDYLIHLCCIEFNCTIDEIKGKTRLRHIVLARHIAMYILKINRAGTLYAIGKMFGMRDHSTVIHACNQIEVLLDLKDTGYLHYLNILEKFNAYIGQEQIQVDENTEIQKPVVAFPIDNLKYDIMDKIQYIENLNTKDAEIKRMTGVEKSTYENVLEMIKSNEQEATILPS